MGSGSGLWVWTRGQVRSDLGWAWDELDLVWERLSLGLILIGVTLGYAWAHVKGLDLSLCWAWFWAQVGLGLTIMIVIDRD